VDTKGGVPGQPGIGGERHYASVDRQAPLSHRFSFRLQNSHYVNWPVPGQSLTTLLHLEAPPSRVRLVYFNDQNTPWTVNGAAMALSAAVGDGHTPVNAVGVADPSQWRRMTFNNGGLDVDPLAPVEGEVYALTLPANPQGSERPVFAFSDWMPVAPLARRGRRFGSLLLVRTYSDQRVRISSGGSPHKAIGRLHAGFCADGNRTIPPWMAPQTRTVGAFAVHGVQYISPSLGATVVGIGDSIMTSSCTTGQTSGFGIRACALVSTPQLPVSYFNEGYPGRNSIDFCSCGIWAIEHLKPQAALIQTWSGNEPWTQDMADLSFARAMSVADTARRNRCVPILVTPAPVFGTNPEAEAYRQRNLTRARASAQHRGYLLDLDALWGTGATPNPIGATMIGATRCTRTTRLVQPPPERSLQCCGRSSAGRSGRPA